MGVRLHEKNTVIDVRPSLLQTVKTLGDQCEKISIVQSGNWRIMNWTLVTNSLLTMKYSTAPMRSGTVVIEVDDGPTLRIEVGTEPASCSDVQEKADIRVDSLTAMRLLFGPLPRPPWSSPSLHQQPFLTPGAPTP